MLLCHTRGCSSALDAQAERPLGRDAGDLLCKKLSQVLCWWRCWCSRVSGAQAERRLGRDAGDLNLIVAHLGAGASMAAIRAGRSVDTSMGLTPLEGCVRAASCSSTAPAPMALHAITMGMC